MNEPYPTRPGKPLTRWSADTETAFLLALRLTGSVTKACAEIGRSTNGACQRRKRLPDFAARWRAALDERHAAWLAKQKARAGEDDPGEMPNRVRRDGWTPKRQRAFLAALTAAGQFEAACRAVRLSATSARAMRREYPSFAAACDRAVAQSPGGLREAAFARAVEGWEEPIVQGGRVVAVRRRYSDGLLRWLAQEAARAAPGPGETGKLLVGEGETVRKGKVVKLRATEEETDTALKKSLDGLALRLEREQRARDVAWADGMLARGLAP